MSQKAKINQQQIDELLQDSSEEYEEEFDQEQGQAIKQEEDLPDEQEDNAGQADYAQQFEEQKEEKEESVQPMEQVSISEHESEIHDEINSNLGEEFKKDDDLSLAQSEYMESQQENSSNKKQEMKKDKAKQPNKADSKKAIEKPKPPITKPKKAQSKPASKPNIKQAPAAKPSAKPKLSESEIKQRMEELKAQKKELQKAKAQKEEKEKEKKKQLYEEALAKEEEKKLKNKAILEEQKKKKVEEKEKPKGKTMGEIQIAAMQEVRDKANKNYTYMEMTKERKLQEARIKKELEEANKEKAKKLKPVIEVEKVKKEQKKQQFLKDKNTLKDAEVKGKKKEAFEQDTLMIKEVKQNINRLRDQIKIKKAKIYEFDKSIDYLQKTLKAVQKEYYEGVAGGPAATIHQQYMDSSASELTPIEKFVGYFPLCSNSGEIFTMLDQNNDLELTLSEIQQKLEQVEVEDDIAKAVLVALDENSDGKVTKQEFSFIIDSEIQRQKKYREIMGEVNILDPLQIEARILDMRAKIKYMDQQKEEETVDSSAQYEEKYEEYMRKIEKIEKIMEARRESGPKADEDATHLEKIKMMAEKAEKLRQSREMKEKLVNSISATIEANLEQKNRILQSKVEENLRMREKIYNLQNKIQEDQLRYLSMQKIKENKRGYLERLSKERQEKDLILKQAREYQVMVSDPTKQLRNQTYEKDIRFLAAVIMIQRNFRKKKAREEVARMKAGR